MAWKVTYTFTVTDACGNTSTTLSYFNTGKNKAGPSIIVTGTIDSAYQTENDAEAAAIHAITATSHCTGAVISSGISSGFNLVDGCHHDIIVSVQDECGNESSYTFHHIIIDNAAPQITCPPTINMIGCSTDNIAIHHLPYSSTASTITLDQLVAEGGTASDNCTIGSITYQDAAVGTNPLVVTRTFTVTDAAGNTATCDQTINLSLPAVPASGGDQAQCENTPTIQTLTATATAPNDSTTVVWFDAATDGNIVADPSLNTTGTVTYYAASQDNASGCYSATRTPVTLTIYALPVVVINNNTNSTELNCTYPSISVTASGGVSYSWSDGTNTVSTSADLTITQPGTYTVTVTDAHSCVNTNFITITKDVATATIGLSTQTNVSCNGGNDGAIDVTVTGGTSPFTYSWTTSDGTIPAGQESQQNPTGLTAGTYKLIVTGANGCSSNELDVTILEPAAVSFDVANTNESCNGTNDATITVSNILGGLPTQTATVTVDGLAPAATYAPGLHTIRVSFPDGNNVSTCYLEKTVTILEPVAVSFDVANTNESCNGTNDATITVSNILGGLPTQTATVTVDGLAPAATYAPGLHTIRVSFPDGNNVSTCYLEKTVTILEPAAVSFDVANTNESCNGTNDATITVSNILGGLPTQTATVTVDGLAPAATYAPGLHTIRVSFPDGNNVSTCYLEKTVTILEPVAVSFDVANTNESCNGTNDATITVSNILGGLPTQTATVTVDGLAPAATYAPGLHTIRVSFPDGNNVSTCYLEKTVTILEPVAVSFDVANTNESCNGTNDATITVSNILGGLPTQTATVTVDGLAPAATYAPGLHTIRVSFPDGNNVSTCYLEKTVTILEPAAVSFDVANTNESCNGTNDATITVSNILGGLPTQTATVTVDGLAPAATYAPGLHTIRVSFPDGNNVSTCYLEKTVTILEPAAVSFDVANTNESCNGTNDATITVSNILGGLPTQTATVTVDGLAPAATYAPGLHTIRVSFPDGNGGTLNPCYLEKTVTILEPAAVSFDVANTNESCNGTNDATITVSNILGGLPTQTATVTVDGLAPALTYAPGLHTIRVSFPDGNNVSTCYLEKTVTILEPEQ